MTSRAKFSFGWSLRLWAWSSQTSIAGSVPASVSNSKPVACRRGGGTVRFAATCNSCREPFRSWWRNARARKGSFSPETAAGLWPCVGATNRAIRGCAGSPSGSSSFCICWRCSGGAFWPCDAFRHGPGPDGPNQDQLWGRGLFRNRRAKRPLSRARARRIFRPRRACPRIPRGSADAPQR